MSPEKMVHMANQIAIFFKSQPGTDASDRVAAHLRDFWEPRMRQQLRDHVAKGGTGLDDLVVQAASSI
ncbi:formate dehydrogenase subunit delta [Pontitalea aquivivens]|uniref:formate dehydrogenase subunit delta n=1 Tax=Pontitalea aquivivens TaxID=3388663 RepID=UPI003970A17B